MKTKICKRIVSSAAALAMLGTSLPANVVQIGLFDKFAITASADSQYYYIKKTWYPVAQNLVSNTVYLDSANFNPLIPGTSFTPAYDNIMTYTDADENVWWYVQKNTDLSERVYAKGSFSLSFEGGLTPTIVLKGSLNIILADGVTLNCPKGIGVNAGTTLNIYGQENGTGKIVAGSDSNKAAIGSDDQDDDSGTNGAGTINIYGGTVEAASGTDAAGIGGGNEAGNGNITIYGGTVTAAGGDYGAGIGTGDEPETTPGTITIYGGTVTATGGKQGAGIGGGNESNGGKIYIYGGTVTAAGTDCDHYGGAGIGGGDDACADYIQIDGGSVTANGACGAAGIGGGSGVEIGSSNGSLGDIVINGGTIHANGKSGGAGIGGGSDMTLTDGNITINNGTVYASSTGTGAGIGGGSSVDCAVNITINNGDIEALSNKAGDKDEDDRSAGIGSGLHGDFEGTINIKGGKVKAVGGRSVGEYYGGAGIGSGNQGNVASTAEINISGGTVEAIGQSGGAAIGAGTEEDIATGGECEGKISITGGTVKLSFGDYRDKDFCYIGHGNNGSEDGTLTLGKNMKVYFDGQKTPVLNLLRTNSLRSKSETAVFITECDHPNPTYSSNEKNHTKSCTYCFTAFSAESHKMDDQNHCTVCGYQGETIQITGASIALADDLALNFYVDGITDANAANYKITFSGDCMETEAALTKNPENGKYYAAAHVTARNAGKQITASLCKGTVVIDTAEPYSVTDYLESAPEKLGLDITQMSDWTTQQQNTYAMIAATQLFCDAASDYFNNTSQFEASYEAYAQASGKTEAKIDAALAAQAANYSFESDNNVFIALSLKNKTRIYIYEGDEIKYTIENLLPQQLTLEQTAGEYKFYGLSWADRVFAKQAAGTEVSQKNLNMAKAVTAYALAAAAYAG